MLIFGRGLCWPQSNHFQQVEEGVWETDAHFGATGDYTLYLVTARDLGRTLVDYYWKVVRLNIGRREKLKDKLKLSDEDLALLGGDYPGIEMSSLPKGFQAEASVNITIADPPPT